MGDGTLEDSCLDDEFPEFHDGLQCVPGAYRGDPGVGFLVGAWPKDDAVGIYHPEG